MTPPPLDARDPGTHNALVARTHKVKKWPAQRARCAEQQVVRRVDDRARGGEAVENKCSAEGLAGEVREGDDGRRRESGAGTRGGAQARGEDGRACLGRSRRWCLSLVSESDDERGGERGLLLGEREGEGE